MIAVVTVLPCNRPLEYGASCLSKKSGAVHLAKRPIFFRLFLVLIRVYSWFFLDDSFVSCVRNRFPSGGWEKLDFVDGFCC